MGGVLKRYERAKLLIGKTKGKPFVDAEYFIKTTGPQNQTTLTTELRNIELPEGKSRK
jgi:hypothetical protein